MQIFSGGIGPIHRICIKPGFFRGGFFSGYLSFSRRVFFGVPASSSSQAFIISLPIGTVIVMNLLHTFFTLHFAMVALFLHRQPKTNTDTDHEND